MSTNVCLIGRRIPKDKTEVTHYQLPILKVYDLSLVALSITLRLDFAPWLWALVLMLLWPILFLHRYHFLVVENNMWSYRHSSSSELIPMHPHVSLNCLLVCCHTRDTQIGLQFLSHLNFSWRDMWSACSPTHSHNEASVFFSSLSDFF